MLRSAVALFVVMALSASLAFAAEATAPAPAPAAQAPTLNAADLVARAQTALEGAQYAQGPAPRRHLVPRAVLQRRHAPGRQKRRRAR